MTADYFVAAEMAAEHAVLHTLGESAWGRTKELYIAQNDRDGLWCDACAANVKSPVVSADVSDGEYGALSICVPCLDAKLEAFKASMMRARSH